MEVAEKYCKYASASAAFRSTIKAFMWGGPKVGKSRLGMGFPGPRAVIDTGEGGVQPYEQPGDLILTITEPKLIMEAWSDLCSDARKGLFATLGLDSGTLFWNRTRDEGTRKATEANRKSDGTLGDVKYQDWGWIKIPTNTFVDRAISVPANVWVTGWQKTMEGEQEGGRIKKVKQVDMARIPAEFIYLFDYLYSLDQEEDSLGRQTGDYLVTFIGGRVPPSVPQGSIFPGRQWRFPSKGAAVKSPEQVYQDILGWLLPYKEQGGRPTLMVEDLEDYQSKANRAWEEIREAGQKTIIGRVAALLMGIQSAAEWKLKTVSLQQAVMGLGGEDARTVQALIDRRKSELGIG